MIVLMSLITSINNSLAVRLHIAPALQDITGRLCIVSGTAGHHRTTLYCLSSCRTSQDNSVLSPTLQGITGRLCIVSAPEEITGRLCIVSSPAGHHRTTLYCLQSCRTSQDDSALSPALQDITGQLCIVSGTAGHHRTTLYCLSSCRTSQDDSVLSPVLQDITGRLCIVSGSCRSPVVLLSSVRDQDGGQLVNHGLQGQV